MLVGCATLIREGNATRSLPYLESRVSANASLLREYSDLSNVARLGFKQLCDAVAGRSLGIDSRPALAAYDVEYPGNRLDVETRRFLHEKPDAPGKIRL